VMVATFRRLHCSLGGIAAAAADAAAADDVVVDVAGRGVVVGIGDFGAGIEDSGNIPFHCWLIAEQ